MAKIKLNILGPSIKKELAKQNQVTAIAQQMIGGLPKATHKQSIQSVMRAIEVSADNNTPQAVKDATALAAVQIVGNSASMDVADMMDEAVGARARELMAGIQNELQGQ